MIGFFARLLLVPAGVIAAWFVAKDSPNFSVVQLVVMLVLVAIVIAVAAFWSTLRDTKRDTKRDSWRKTPDA